jgi:hypothetical protein
MMPKRSDADFQSVPGFFPAADFNKVLADLRKAGYTVKRDPQAGTAVAYMDGTVKVFKALQFGHGRPWKLWAKPGLFTFTAPTA